MTVLLAAGIVSTLAVSAPAFSPTPAYQLKGLPEKTHVTCVTSAGDRALIGTDGKGVWALAKASSTLVQVGRLPSTAAVNSIVQVRGRAMIGTWRNTSMNPYKSASEGVWALPDGDTKLRPIEGLPTDTSAQSFTQVGGRTLLGTYGHGLWAVPDGTYAATRISGPPDGDPVKLIGQQGDRAIVTTYHHGIWVVPLGSSKAVRLQNDASVAPALCIANGDGRTLIGTSCGGLWMLEDGSDRVIRIAGIPADDVVRCITITPDNAVIGSMTGLYLLGAGESSAVKILGHGILDLASVGGKVYVGTESHGLWTMKAGTRVAKRVQGGPADAYFDRFTLGNGQVVSRVFGLDDRSSAIYRIGGLPAPIWVTDTEYFAGRFLIGTGQAGIWAMNP
jgi:hypothetical protein